MRADRLTALCDERKEWRCARFNQASFARQECPLRSGCTTDASQTVLWTDTMRCFYHQDKEGVGSCKSCGKALCAACAIDLGKGLACRGRCEPDVTALIQLIERNIKTARDAGRGIGIMQSARPQQAERDFQLSATLSSYVERTQKVMSSIGILSLLVGVVFMAWGFANRESFAFLAILSLCFVSFGFGILLATRKSRQIAKATAKTQTS